METEKRKNIKPIVLLASFFGALSSPLIKLGTAPGNVLAFYRVFMTTLLTLPYVLIKHNGEIRELPKKTLLLSLLSGVCLGLHFCCYFTSLSLTSVSSSVVLVNSEVFFVAAAMLLIFSEHISLTGWLGIVAAFIGSVIIAVGDAGLGGDNLYGDLLAFAGAFAMSIYTILGRVCRSSASTSVYTVIVYAGASVTTLAVNLIGGVPVVGYEPKNYLIGLLLALLCNILCHTVLSWSLKYEAPSFISMAKLTQPIYATIIAAVFFSDPPKAHDIIGGLIVIAGLFVYTQLGRVTKARESAKD